MKDKLKPCPFCGRDKLGLDKNNYKYRVICINPNCHIKNYSNSNWHNTKKQAIEVWNRRVENER